VSFENFVIGGPRAGIDVELAIRRG